MAAVCAAGPEPIITILECMLLAVLGIAVAEAEDSLCSKPAAANGTMREGRSDDRSGLRKAEENSLAVGTFENT